MGKGRGEKLVFKVGEKLFNIRLFKYAFFRLFRICSVPKAYRVHPSISFLICCDVRDLGMDMPYKRAMGASLFQRPDFTQLVTAARASTTPLVFLPHDHHSEKSEDSASGAHLHPSNSDMDSNHPEMGVSADATIRAFFATPSPGASQAKSSPTEAAAAAAKGAKGKNSGDGGGECLGKGSSEKRRSPSDEDGSGGCAQCGATVANQQGSSSAPNTRLSACARCKKVYYCGRTCQAAHWKAGHKKACVLAES